MLRITLITLALTVFAIVMAGMEEHHQDRTILIGGTVYIVIMMWGYSVEFRKISIILEEVRNLLKELRDSK